MAVYTNVDDDALAGFLEAYDLGTVLSFAGIAEGVENSNYLLRTDRAHYILTLYEKRVDSADLPFFIEVMQVLANRALTARCRLPRATAAFFRTFRAAPVRFSPSSTGPGAAFRTAKNAPNWAARWQPCI